MKWCPRCKREREESAFYRDVHRKSGLSSWCKQCKNVQTWAAEKRRRLRLKHVVKAGQDQFRIAELYAEEEYLVERLEFVRGWIRKLIGATATVAALVLAACAAPLTETKPEASRAVQIDAQAVAQADNQMSFEQSVQRTFFGAVEPHDVVDMNWIMAPAFKVEEVAPPVTPKSSGDSPSVPPGAVPTADPGYGGSGPSPTFAEPPGRFGQVYHRCQDQSGGSPLLLMDDTLPTQGTRFRLIAWSPGGASQSIAMSTRNDYLADGTPLPQPIRGAPGCLVEVPHDSHTLLAPGRAEFDLILPPGSKGLVVYMQIITLSPDANEAGYLVSHGYRMVIGP